MTNICGESNTDEVKVSFTSCDNCITVPSAFSPNGDGLNDRFEIFTSCPLQYYNLSIFNRWGQLVYTTYTPGQHWDGNLNGSPVDVGVYYYKIEASSTINGTARISKKGDITLLR